MGQRRSAAQEACAEDPGCAHGKLNSELLLNCKSRAAGSSPRAAGAKAQERLRLADLSEGGPQVCRLGIRFQPSDNVHPRALHFMNVRAHSSPGKESLHDSPARDEKLE